MIKNILKNIDRRIQDTLTIKTAPPAYEIKRAIIEKYAQEYKTDVFIETGTYLGETVDALKNKFEKLISIELAQKLYEQAKEKFKNNPNVLILQGDSGTVLESILQSLDRPALFWLDGHWSGGETARGEGNTPILKELTTVLNHHIKKHVILIDDARCFNGENGYPTIKELLRFVTKINNCIHFTVENDIIRIIPTDTVQNNVYNEPVREILRQQYSHLRKTAKNILIP